MRNEPLLRFAGSVLLGALVVIVATLPARAQSSDTVINIRLSFKAVLNPFNGDRAMLGDREVGQVDVDAIIDGMNVLMAEYGRGYRFVESGELIDVGEVGGFFTGPSQWFSVDFFDDTDAKAQMDAVARANPVTYAWNGVAINIYIVDDFGGAKCSTSDEEQIIVASVGVMDDPEVILHEIGHFFNLCHTQGCSCADCAGDLGTACTAAGDDEVADTLADVQCWDLDDISLANYFQPYDALPDNLQENVVNTARNLMSYHNQPPLSWSTDRLTEGQLDRWTDTIKAALINPYRAHVVDGFTFVVPDDWTLTEARGEAGADDIILLRPGTSVFFSTVTLDEPTTYRATRAGEATIVVSP